MDSTTLYDDDILAWSEQQAAALRRLASRGDLPNDLDLEHIVEEIEDVGQGELREVRVLLGRALAQLVLSWAAPDAEPDWQWTGKVIGWLGEAELRFAPSMAGHIGLDDLWSGAVRQAIHRLEIVENGPAAVRARMCAGTPCPFSVGTMLGEDFRIKDALELLEMVSTSTSP